MLNTDSKSHFIFRINENGSGPNLLHQVCVERGWKAFEDINYSGSSEQWNLWWRTKGFPVLRQRSLNKDQFTNHIPNASFICRKDNLIRCIKCMKNIYGSCYDFVPDGFNLPLEYKKLIAMSKSGKQLYISNDNEKTDKQIWICKPVGLSQGRGISLFQNPRDLVYNSNAIVQKYVKNPLLIGGYKFDLRLYVLVPSFHPLIIYIYKEGLARFGTEKFTLNNLKNKFAHLTNSSLNKYGPGYLETKERVGAGCKWNLQQLRCYLQQTVGSDWLLWQNISTLIVLTIASQLTKVSHTTNCFEFYGFDILIDSKLKPWLIEVNLSPALSIDCRIDPEIKKPMIHELFDLLGFPVCNTGLSFYAINKNRRSEVMKQCSNKKSSKTVVKAVVKWKKKRLNVNSRSCKNHYRSSFRIRDASENDFEKNLRWGNGKDWNFPEASCGNWIRVFPSLSSEKNKIKFTKSINHIHRTFSTDEIKSVVSSAVSFFKVAKEIVHLNQDADDNRLNSFMASHMLPESKIWLPPS